jgi:hypothetical protein
MENVKKIVVILSLLLVNVGFSQQKFYKVYGGTGYDRGYGILQLKDSGYAICGTTSSIVDAPSQAYVSRMDKAGNILWATAIGGTESEEARDITKSGKGNFFVSGFSTSGVSSNFDAYTFFIDTNGLLIWEKRIDFGGWEQWNEGVELKDSTVFLVGKSESTTSSSNAHILARINQTGDTLFTKKIPYTGASNLTGVWKYTDTSVVVCGSVFNQDSLKRKAYLAVYHNNGTLIWEKQYGIHGEFVLNDITMRGTEIFACGTHPIGATSAEFNLMTNFTGDLIYGFEITDSHVTKNLCLANTTTSGNGFIVGFQKENASFPTFVNGEDTYIGRYDGGLFWNYAEGYSGIGQDQTNEIASTLDGSAVAIGYHTTVGELSNTIFVIKLGPDLSYPTHTASSVFNVATIEDLVDSQVSVYPNPFSDFIQIEIEHESKLSIVSLNGEVLMNKTIQSSEKIDLSNLTNGMYIVKLVSENGTFIHKIQKQ